MVNSVPFIGAVNAYDAKDWNEARAGRMASKHCKVSAMVDASATVRWINDILLKGRSSLFFLACLSYAAGIAVGVHRERQRHKGKAPANK